MKVPNEEFMIFWETFNTNQNEKTAETQELQNI